MTWKILGENLGLVLEKTLPLRLKNLIAAISPLRDKSDNRQMIWTSWLKPQDYFELTVNGQSLSGRWQLTGFNLNDGDWNQVTPGTITAQSYMVGDMGTAGSSGGDYAGWDIGQAEWQYLESFSDSFLLIDREMIYLTIIR